MSGHLVDHPTPIHLLQTKKKKKIKGFKLKIAYPMVGLLQVFRKRGLKLVEYCKTRKSYVSDSKLTKKKEKKIDAKGKQFQKF